MRISTVCPAALTALVTLFSLPAFALQPPAAPPPQVLAHTTWDNRYIYFAFTVDDTDIRGTNTKPMSEAAKDDSIAVYIHTGKERPEAPTAATHGMIVSAAGGFQFVQGNPATKDFGPHPLFTIKYGVKLAGTINRSDDRDQNYTVTLAIPLDALGVDTKTITPGMEFAFNAVARTKDGKRTALIGPATTETDVASPKTWARLVLASDKGDDAAKKAGAIVSLHVKDKSPLIDGTYREQDWPAAGAFQFTSPDVPKPVIQVHPTLLPGSAADNVAPTLALLAPVRGMERRTLARYLMAYQGDGRKPANPFRGIFGPDRTFFLSEQPATGIGPWFSTDRTSWHRGQLTELRHSGIDAALVTYAGPESELGPLDEKSLVVMVAALREMTSENVPTPTIAPCLDARGLVSQGTPKPDLGTAEGRALLYRALRRWFDLIPPEYRFRVTLPPDANGNIVSGYPFFIDSADGLTNSGGPEWAEEIRKQFAADYGPATGGATLLFVGGEGFAASPAFVATAPLRAGGAGTGPIKTFVIQPGVANPEVTPEGKPDPRYPFVARRAGQTYKDNWEAATSAQPAWFIVDSWNDYLRGTAIDTSRQYGHQYQDATRIALIQASGLPPRALRWLADDAPRRMRPGQLVGVSVTLSNAGMQVLKGTDDIALAYRWRKGKEIVAESPLRLRLSGALLPSQTAQLPIGVISGKPGEGGKIDPLPVGDYTLEIDLSETKEGKTFFLSDLSPDTTQPLRVPVSIVPLADAVEIAATTTTPLLMSGGNYGSQVRLRWLGDNPLPPDSAELVYQILSEDGKDTIFTGTAPLIRPLPPGGWVTVPTIIRIGDAAAPVSPAAPEFRKSATDPTGGYQIRWLLTRRDSPDAVPGQYVEHVAVYPPEEEVKVAFSDAQPLKVDADSLTPVTVSVTNKGTAKWSKDAYRVGYHWYYADGLELLWKPPVTSALPKDVAPGETVKVTLSVRAPDRAGEYILAADVVRLPDVYLSTRMITRTGDLGLLPARVTGGRLTFINLEHLFNKDGVATEAAPKEGDLDGAGASVPAESFPPDEYGIAAYFADDKDRHNGPVYPSGHFCDASPSARSVAFRYGSDLGGAKNVIACAGQQVPVHGAYAGLHLAAAATGGKDVSTVLVLHYKDGTSQRATVNIGDWNRLPGPEDPVAERVPYRRAAAGDTDTPCIVRHIIVPLDVTKELSSVELPKDDHVKVFAITLEK